jgi:hypothetical protein
MLMFAQTDNLRKRGLQSPDKSCGLSERLNTENAAQKEKGRNRGVAADSPESYYTKTKTLCKS